MADLTPDERAALLAAVNAAYETNWADVEPCDVAIWRAARAYQAEQDARIVDKVIANFGNRPRGDNQYRGILDAACITALMAAAHDIRELAKGLT